MKRILFIFLALFLLIFESNAQANDKRLDYPITNIKAGLAWANFNKEPFYNIDFTARKLFYSGFLTNKVEKGSTIKWILDTKVNGNETSYILQLNMNANGVDLVMATVTINLKFDDSKQEAICSYIKAVSQGKTYFDYSYSNSDIKTLGQIGGAFYGIVENLFLLDKEKMKKTLGIYDDKEELAKVKQSGKYDRIYDFEDGLARVKTNNKWGLIDKTGKEIIPLKYDGIDNFSKDGLAKVTLNGKDGFIDKTGKEIIPVKYDYIDDLKDELVRVQLDGKWGVVDKTSKKIITPIKYDSIDTFLQDGLAQVSMGGKYGFIDKTTGEEIIPVKYDKISNFSEDGLAKARIGKEGFYINKKGERINK